MPLFLSIVNKIYPLLVSSSLALSGGCYKEQTPHLSGQPTVCVMPEKKNTVSNEDRVLAKYIILRDQQMFTREAILAQLGLEKTKTIELICNDGYNQCLGKTAPAWQKMVDKVGLSAIIDVCGINGSEAISDLCADGVLFHQFGNEYIGYMNDKIDCTKTQLKCLEQAIQEKN